ncbi:putative Monocarboxylate transporter 13 [Hypsibius exemplaris]|uniref:Monocarboxylate transporter 13 n=1 Tax=Hypsibius exemplaris TaxID=2072580 RepID=A0A1W0WEM5_HYPEX|nr:putative Monocarboxylate transporter 13 [Hypsibius exemplaris]
MPKRKLVLKQFPAPAKTNLHPASSYSSSPQQQEPNHHEHHHGHLLKNTQLCIVQEKKVCDLIPVSYVDGMKPDPNDGTPGQSPATSTRELRPREGGYGWVIVGAAFLCSFIVDGVANSFGMYLITFKETYPEEPESVISWIGSLLVGVYLCMGPIACGLADSFGYRLVITSGSLIAATGFLSSFFVTNVHVLFLTFGVVGGIGFGLIYSPSIMCVCAYFKETSALAVGLAVCGSSVGGMVFPIFVQLILERYGWEGSMLFLAGVALQCCIAGTLMRTPIRPPRTLSLEVLQQGRRSPCLPPLLHQALIDMTSLKVYLNPTFLIYSLASFIGSIAFLTPSFFLPDFAFKTFANLDKETAAAVMTAVCGAGIFGRLIFGYLADHPYFDPLGIHNVCIFTSGVLLALVPVCGSFTILLVDGVFYGFFIAPYISLMSTILTSRLGLEQLPSAFGQTQLIAGLASVVGPPLHGTLGEMFSVEIPFYFAGGAWILASIVASVIFLLPRRRCSRSHPVNSQHRGDLGENGQLSETLLV